KGDAWEGGHRVPLIIAGPGIAAAAECSNVVSLLDIFPMFRDVLGVGAASVTDGVSLLPALHKSGGRHECVDNDRVLAQQAFNGMLSLREGSLKFVFGSGSGGFSSPKGRPGAPQSVFNQLYDLREDPRESENLWSFRTREADIVLRK